MYRRARLPVPLVAGAVGVGVLSGNVIFRPALEEYWSQHPTEQEDASSSGTAPDESPEPASSTEAAAAALTKA